MRLAWRKTSSGPAISSKSRRGGTTTNTGIKRTSSEPEAGSGRRAGLSSLQPKRTALLGGIDDCFITFPSDSFDELDGSGAQPENQTTSCGLGPQGLLLPS